jgi:hypothetical protein
MRYFLHPAKFFSALASSRWLNSDMMDKCLHSLGGGHRTYGHINIKRAPSPTGEANPQARGIRPKKSQNEGDLIINLYYSSTFSFLLFFRFLLFTFLFCLVQEDPTHKKKRANMYLSHSPASTWTKPFLAPLPITAAPIASLLRLTGDHVRYPPRA